MDLSSGKIIDSFYANDFSCFKGSPDSLTTAVGQIVYGLQLRRDKGLHPFTVLSCDNVQGKMFCFVVQNIRLVRKWLQNQGRDFEVCGHG